MMDVSQQSQPQPGAVASFEAVLSCVRRDCAAALTVYERTVTLSSVRSAVVGVMLYTFAFVLLASTRVFFTLATVVLLYGAGVYFYCHVDTYMPKVSAAAAAAAAAGENTEAPDNDNAGNTQETDPCLLKSLARVLYAIHHINVTLRALSGNTLMASLGLLSATPILLILFAPIRLMAFLAGLYCLFYPSFVHQKMDALVEPYVVQFKQMHAGSRTALRSVASIITTMTKIKKKAVDTQGTASERRPEVRPSTAPGQGTAAEDNDSVADDMLDDMFKQALVDELESASGTSGHSDSEEIQSLDDDEDEVLIEDSLLGLETGSHETEQTRLEHEYAASGADLWDHNQTIDLDAEFARGLSFPSLRRTSPYDGNSSEVDGRLTVSTPDVQTHSTSSASASTPSPLATSASLSATTLDEPFPPASRGEVTASASSVDEQHSVVDVATSQPAIQLVEPATGVAPAAAAIAQEPPATSATQSEATAGEVSPLSVEDRHFSSSSSRPALSQCTSLSSPTVSTASRDDFEVISMEEAATMPDGGADVNSQPSTVEQVSSALAAPTTYLKTWLSGEQ